MVYADNTRIRTEPLYRGLIRSARVAGAFSAIITVLLLTNALFIGKRDTHDVKQLQELQRHYDSLPHNDTVAGKIRVIDEQLRRDMLRRQRFGQTGTILWTISLVTAAICLLIARMLLRAEPTVPTEAICSGEFVLWAKRTRIAIITAAAVLAAVGIFFVFYEL